MKQVSFAYDAVMATPWAGLKLGLRVDNEGLSGIDFLPADVPDRAPENTIARLAVEELTQYFSDSSRRFSLPLTLKGTPFQRRVWKQLQKLPPGTVCSYGELARRLQSSPRAIGGACRANPVPIIIPCHRVVAAHGVGGFMGKTQGRALKIKHYLLSHEQIASICR